MLELLCCTTSTTGMPSSYELQLARLFLPHALKTHVPHAMQRFEGLRPTFLAHRVHTACVPLSVLRPSSSLTVCGGCRIVVRASGGCTFLHVGICAGMLWGTFHGLITCILCAFLSSWMRRLQAEHLFQPSAAALA